MTDRFERSHPRGGARLWAQYRRALYRFVLPRVGDHDAAEEIVQEAVVRAYLHQAALREPSKLRAWLFQIARNGIVDHFRRARARPLPDGAVEIEVAPPRDEAAALHCCLRPMLAALPRRYRKALERVDMAGVTHRTLADELGLSVSGAKSRVQRGRKMLREALLRCCRIETDRRGGIVTVSRK